MNIAMNIGITLFLCFYMTAYARNSVDSLANTCINGTFHKPAPGPEPALHGQCSSWSGNACCTANVTREFHVRDRWYGFSYNHCPGHRMSDKCKKRFLRELCSYECSPYLGPWLKPQKFRIRTERAHMIPICEQDCEMWWEDCKDDYTCVTNWEKGFEWRNGRNECPVGAVCNTFSNKFGNSSNMCKAIWNNRYAPTMDSKPCFKVWWVAGNPNVALARMYAEKILDTGGTSSSITTGKLARFTFLLPVIILLTLL